MQKQSVLFDFCGIGIGPFNLGLAALSSGIPNLNAIFFDRKPCFNWHEGMLIDWTRLQVPFYADLVTLADPCNRYSFLNFLKSQNRLFQFAISEEHYVLRQEYNQYCKWVAQQLQNLYFNSCVVTYDTKSNSFEINMANRTKVHAKKLVLGVGTQPYIPVLKPSYSSNIFHSSDYLKNKENLNHCSSCIIIGSGQSAAEIFYDLLSTWHTADKKLHWYTRSSRFYAMDTSSFSCEHSTPDYIRYFYQLPNEKKKNIFLNQQLLYKGINEDLIKQIYNLLYLKMIKEEHHLINLQTHCAFKNLIQLPGKIFEARLASTETDALFSETAETVIFSTGYTYTIPDFINPVKHMINFTEDDLYCANRQYAIDRSGNKIFVQNAEIHTHGFNAPDLSLGPYRNAIILNTITGKKHFSFAEKNVFQNFSAG
jgi:lysine N6-hydroxylase